jgi:hypothetical protein
MMGLPSIVIEWKRDPPGAEGMAHPFSPTLCTLALRVIEVGEIESIADSVDTQSLEQIRAVSRRAVTRASSSSRRALGGKGS